MRVTSPLITSESLLARLHDPDVVVLEVSFREPEDAPYFAGHIPGSRYAYWKDLLWHELNRQIATPTVTAERLGLLSVGDVTTLVSVGDPLPVATYAYWVLEMTGFEAQSRVIAEAGRRKGSSATLTHGQGLITHAASQRYDVLPRHHHDLRRH